MTCFTEIIRLIYFIDIQPLYFNYCRAITNNSNMPFLGKINSIKACAHYLLTARSRKNLLS